MKSIIDLIWTPEGDLNRPDISVGCQGGGDEMGLSCGGWTGPVGGPDETFLKDGYCKLEF